MKTLDEVIAIFTECFENAWSISPIEADMTIGDDALHYLKEYKKTRQDLLDGMKRLEDKEMMYIHAIADLEDNPPLSWTELQQMEEKPVWVENKFYKKWLIAKQVNDTDIIFDGNGYYTQAFRMDFGMAWQAYRKERK